MKHEEIQFKRARQLRLELKKGKDPYPEIVEIQPSEFCNQRCNYCFHSRKKITSEPKNKYLNIEQYSALFSDLKKMKVKYLSISGGGEPFLYNDIIPLIKSAHETGIKTRIVTNGTLMTRALMEELLRSQEIRFSVDAIKPSTFEKIRGVNEETYQELIQKIKELIILRNESKSRLSIGVTMLLSDKNYMEVEDFCKNFLELGVDRIIIKNNVYGKKALTKNKVNEITRKLDFMKDKRVEIRAKHEDEIFGTKCFIPYFKIAINPSGGVYSCCLAAQPTEKNGFFLGNLTQDSLRDIWNKSKDLRLHALTNGVSCIVCNHTDISINKLMEST